MPRPAGRLDAGFKLPAEQDPQERSRARFSQDFLHFKPKPA